MVLNTVVTTYKSQITVTVHYKNNQNCHL